ncbi:MAG: hypothetical protein IJZ42_13415 [Lachnospiraceae bacterium]|nr:hypothetical protein [Lachnospiraceae bacterium]
MNKHTDKVELLAFEYGVLLSKDDPEFEAYSVVNPKLPCGFYDEAQGYALRENLESEISRAREYVEQGVDKTYAVISFQGLYDTEVAKEFCDGRDDELPSYTCFQHAQDIAYSVCKIDGVIQEGFLEAMLMAIENSHIPDIYKEISEDAVNAMENTLRDGFAPTFIDNCVELPFSDNFHPGYGLVVWGEEGEQGDRFYSIAVCKCFEGEMDESVAMLFTETTSFDELENGVEAVLAKFEDKLQKQFFIPDEEIVINDDTESVNIYLWALDGLVDRLSSAQEMDNINFYADYNVRTGDVALSSTFYTYSQDGQEQQQTVPVTLNSSEQRLLIDAVEQYCESLHNCSCIEFVNDMRKEESMEPLFVSSAKSSLADVIRSASAKASDINSIQRQSKEEIDLGQEL